MITGARLGAVSGIRRLLSSAFARDLSVFMIPGPEIARAHGLDIEQSGLRIVSTPRHASVLMVIGTIPPALCDAASIIYAQMPRPRAVFVLGSESSATLPEVDVTADLSPQGLKEGVDKLRQLFTESSFKIAVKDFDAQSLQVRIEFTCPMHPEIIRDEPGKCPICGMFLIEKETQATTAHVHTPQHDSTAPVQSSPESNHHQAAHKSVSEYTCPMHPEVIQDEPGSCPKCGMDLVLQEDKATDHHHHAAHKSVSEYTCPMHPEVTQDEPGSCPKCGMDLVLQEDKTTDQHQHAAHKSVSEYACPMHPEVTQDAPGSCPKCGMDLVLQEDKATDHHHHATHKSVSEYTCPMHPEVAQDEPGSCPKCGMDLVERKENTVQAQMHTGMDHSKMSHNEVDHSKMDQSDMNHDDMNHGDTGFMSMVDVTKDLPRSRDGLQMEWIDAPFGPFFPGLPGGLLLSLTLDGDAVAHSETRSLIANTELLQHSPMGCESFVNHISLLEPLSPVSFRQLACLALENAAMLKLPGNKSIARIGALERERITSHLNWLALFAQQTGYDWLLRRAAKLQLKIQKADFKQLMDLKPDILKLIKKLHRAPLLKSRLKGIGVLAPDDSLCGPVARASGIKNDTRTDDEFYTMLDFKMAGKSNGDVYARMLVHLDEIASSLALIETAGSISLPELEKIGSVSATGEAHVETPRGPAQLQLTLENGKVTSAQLETPSTKHLGLIDTIIKEHELGDALLTVSSLDLSPWEVQQ